MLGAGVSMKLMVEVTSTTEEPNVLLNVTAVVE